MTKENIRIEFFYDQEENDKLKDFCKTINKQVNKLNDEDGYNAVCEIVEIMKKLALVNKEIEIKQYDEWFKVMICNENALDELINSAIPWVTKLKLL